MKKLLAIFPVMLGLVLVVPHAAAQDASSATPAATATTKATKTTKKSGGASAAKADSDLADLDTRLTLTDDEKAKIKPILDDETAKIHAVEMAKTGSKDDEKAKTKVIRDAANTQIRAVLTPDQQKTFDSDSKKGTRKAATPAA
jgi:Spy/CpxP family protein refolding chaperone